MRITAVDYKVAVIAIYRLVLLYNYQDTNAITGAEGLRHSSRRTLIPGFIDSTCRALSCNDLP